MAFEDFLNWSGKLRTSARKHKDGSVITDVNEKDSDLRENPFQTKIGQEVVSVQESFESRLWREGRPLNAFSGDVNAASGVMTSTSQVRCSPGCVFYPLSVKVSCNVDAMLYIVYGTNMADVGPNLNGVMYEVAFCKAGTPLEVKLNGDVKIYEGGTVSVAAVPTAVGKLYGSVRGIEVTTND